MEKSLNHKLILKSIRTNDVWMYAFILILSLMILSRDIYSISINKYYFIAMATVAFCIGKKNDIYCILAFITPLCSGIPYTFISLIAIVILLLKEDKKQFYYVGSFCIVAICFLELLSVTQGYFSFGAYIRFLGVFVIAYGRMIDANESFDNQRILSFFIIGMIVALISVWGQMLQAYSYTSILSMGNLNIRFGNTKEILDITEEGMRIYFNPNGLGYLCCISALLSLVLLKKSNNKTYYVLLIVFSLQGIMTGSRTFIVAYPIGIIAYLILQRKKLQPNFKIIFAAIASACILLVLSEKFFITYVEALIRRFDVSDITNGRGTLLFYYFDQWSNSVWRMIFGAGIQNYQVKYNATNSSHNSFQEVLITWGIIGLIIVVILLFTILRQAKRKNPYIQPFQYVPFFTYLLLTLAGQGFSDASGMLRLMVTYSALMLVFENKHKQENGIDMS